MARAAALLGISRPAIAKRIRNLESLAGQSLLERSGRGVALTDHGATLLSFARRILDERDAILRVLTDIRGERGPAADGLRTLLAETPAHARASQQPEARLAEAERLLELVLQASSTGVVITDEDPGTVHVVNDAFCRFLGRTREELIARAGDSCNVWEDTSVRDEMVTLAQGGGPIENVTIRVRRPDGRTRAGRGSARTIMLGGARKVLWTLEPLPDSGERFTRAAPLAPASGG